MVRNVSLIVRWQQRFCHATNQNKIRLSGKTYVAFEREYSRWRSPEPLARPQNLALLLLILQHSLQGSFQFYNFWTSLASNLHFRTNIDSNGTESNTFGVIGSSVKWGHLQTNYEKSHISKLAFSSRAQIEVWAVEIGLMKQAE